MFIPAYRPGFRAQPFTAALVILGYLLFPHKLLVNVKVSQQYFIPAQFTLNDALSIFAIIWLNKKSTKKKRF